MKRNKIVVLGIDTGWQFLGAARISFSGGIWRAEHISVIQTKDDKTRNAAANEVLRATAIWKALQPAASAHIDALAYEVYNPFVGEQRTAKGSKVAFSCGLAVGLGLSLGVPVIPVRPDEQKQSVTGSGRVSKGAVMNALRARVEGLAEKLDTLRAGQANHASDAAAVAYTGIMRILGSARKATP